MLRLCQAREYSTKFQSANFQNLNLDESFISQNSKFAGLLESEISFRLSLEISERTPRFKF